MAAISDFLPLTAQIHPVRCDYSPMVPRGYACLALGGKDGPTAPEAAEPGRLKQPWVLAKEERAATPGVTCSKAGQTARSEYLALTAKSIPFPNLHVGPLYLLVGV